MKKSLFKIIILSLFSVLVITMGLFFSINVYAENPYTAPTLNGDNFYELSSPNDLNWFSYEVNKNKHYTYNAILKNDIQINDVDISTVEDKSTINKFNPIGDYVSNSATFQGIFDGNNHKISGVYINGGTQRYIGFFGSVKNATIKDLTLENVYFEASPTTTYYIGGIIGYAASKTAVYNCNASGTLHSEVDKVTQMGGIVGYINSSEKNRATISNVTSNMNLSLTSTKECNIGGIVGYSRGLNLSSPTSNSVITTNDSKHIVGGIVGYTVYTQIKDATSNTSFTSTSSNVGGIVGESRNQTEINSCINNGSITAKNAGGIVCHAVYGNVINCENNGDMTATNYAGGIVAGVTTRNFKIESCVNNGNCHSDLYAAGILAYSGYETSVTYSKNTGEITGGLRIGGIVGNTYAQVLACENYGYIHNAEAACGGIAAQSRTVKYSFNQGKIDSNNSDARVSGISIFADSISNCYNTGEIVKHDDQIAFAICADSDKDKVILNCYYTNTNVAAVNHKSSGSYAKKVTLGEFESGKIGFLLNDEPYYKQTIGVDLFPTIIGNAETIYKQCDNGTPSYSNTKGEVSHHYENGICGCGDLEIPEISSDGTYLIKNAGNLLYFAQEVNKGNNTIDGKLLNNIVINENLLNKVHYTDNVLTSIDDSNLVRFAPIGNAVYPYNGKFDGNYYFVKGLFMDDYEILSSMFGAIGKTGVVKNLSIKESIIIVDKINTSDYSPFFSGILYGANAGLVDNINITSCMMGVKKNSETTIFDYNYLDAMMYSCYRNNYIAYMVGNEVSHYFDIDKDEHIGLELYLYVIGHGVYTNPFIENDFYILNSIRVDNVLVSVSSIIDVAYIGEGITELGERCFYLLSPKHIVLPSTLEIIGDHSIAGCDGSVIIIPDSVTTIKASAFAASNCKGVVLPKSVKELGVLWINSGAVVLYLGTKEEYLALGQSISNSNDYVFGYGSNFADIGTINLQFAYDNDGNPYAGYYIEYICDHKVAKVPITYLRDYSIQDCPINCFISLQIVSSLGNVIQDLGTVLLTAENSYVYNRTVTQSHISPKIEVLINDELGQPLSSEYRVDIYSGTDLLDSKTSENGKVVFKNYPRGTYSVQCVLSDDLILKYQAVSSIEISLSGDNVIKTINLVPIKEKEITFTVVDEEELPLANAKITVDEIYSSRIHRYYTITTDDTGKANVTAHDVPVKYTMKLNGYYVEEGEIDSKTKSLSIVGSLISGSPVILNVLSISQMGIVSSVDNMDKNNISIYNKTKNQWILDYYLYDRTVYLPLSMAEYGDVISFGLSNIKNNTSSTEEITLEEYSMVNLTLHEMSYFEFINTNAYVHIFNSNNELVASFNARRTNKSPYLEKGSYKILLIDDDLGSHISSLDELSKYPLVENQDYYLLTKELTDSICDVIGYTVQSNNDLITNQVINYDTTVTLLSSTSLCIGEFVTVRILLDNVKNYSGTLEISIPKECSYQNTSLRVDGESRDATITDDKILIQITSADSQIKYTLRCNQEIQYVEAKARLLVNDTFYPIPKASYSIYLLVNTIKIENDNNERYVNITGRTLINSVIEVYDNNLLLGKAISGLDGVFSFKEKIAENREDHCIYFKVFKNEKLVAISENKEFYSLLFNVEHFIVSTVNGSVDIASGPKRAYSFDPSNPEITVAAKLSLSVNSVDLYMTLNNGKVSKLPLTYDESTGFWRGVIHASSYSLPNGFYISINNGTIATYQESYKDITVNVNSPSDGSRIDNDKFSVTQIGPTLVAKAEEVTFRINGSMISSTAKFTVVGNGSIIEPSMVYYVSLNEVYVTFDLSRTKAGVHSLRIESGYEWVDKEFTISDTAKHGYVSYELNVNPYATLNAKLQGNVVLTNCGLSDCDTKVIVLHGTDVTFKNGKSSLVDIISANGLCGTLLAGEEAIYYFDYTVTGNKPKIICTFLDKIGTDMYNAVDVSKAGKDAVLENVNSLIGTNANTYQKALADAANYLSTIGFKTVSYEDCQMVIAAQARGVIFSDSLFADTIISKDYFKFYRVYNYALERRLEEGMLGLGFVTNFELKFTKIKEDYALILPEETVFFNQYMDKYFSCDGLYEAIINGSNVIVSKEDTKYYFTNGTLMRVESRGVVLYEFEYNSGKLAAVHGLYDNVTFVYDGKYVSEIYLNGNLLERYINSNGYLMGVRGDVNYNYTYILNQRGALFGALSNATINDNTIHYNYDSLGRLTSIENGANSISYEYLGGLLVRMNSAKGETLLFLDYNGHVTKEITCLGLVKDTYYTADGLETMINGLKQSSTLDYRNRITMLKFADGSTITYTYSDSECTIKDYKGNTYRYLYDNNGTLVGVTYPDGTKETYTYTNGLLTAKKNRDDTVVNYTYDIKGRVSKITYPDGSYIEYEYNPDSSASKIKDDTYSMSFAYTSDGLLDSVTYKDGKTLRYEYDEKQRIASITDPLGRKTVYEYDEYNLISKIKNSSGTTLTEYTYDEFGRVIKQKNSSSSYTEYTYEKGYIKSVINYGKNKEVLSKFVYSYNTYGLVEVVDTIDDKIFYYYDDLGRVYKIMGSKVNITYAYDSFGNRKKMIIYGDITSTIDYLVNELNQYTYIGEKTFNYDANGNLSTITEGENIISYTFNAKNQLVEITDGTNVYTYTYDFFGNRDSITINGTTTNYYYTPGENGQLIASQTGTKGISYIYGKYLVGAYTNSKMYYYDYDALGNVHEIVNNSGVVQNSYTYDGNYSVNTSVEAITNPFTFGGKFGYFDDKSNVYKCGNRYILKDELCFISPERNGVALGINLYQYAGSNHVNLIDNGGDCGVVATALIVGVGLGVGTQLAVDVLSGKLSSGGAYVGSVVSGAATGAAGALVTATGGTGIALGAAINASGAVIGTYVSTFVDYGLYGKDFTWDGLRNDVVANAATSAFTGAFSGVFGKAINNDNLAGFVTETAYGASSNWFDRLFGPDPAYDFSDEEEGFFMVFDDLGYLYYLGIIPMIDPAGYVCEAVSSNRISDVKCTLYYSEVSTGKNAIVFTSDYWGQENPLFSDSEGKYAWDVPEGYWQVKFEKEGYFVAYSEWLPVPPIQLDVNVSLVSLASPTVEDCNLKKNEITFSFSQYVKVSEINSSKVKITSDGKVLDGTFTALDAEESFTDNTVMLAKTFKFTPTEEFNSLVTIEIDGVENYTNTPLESVYTKSYDFKTSTPVDPNQGNNDPVDPSEEGKEGKDINSGLPVGAVVGISIGAVVFVAAIVGVIVFVVIKKKKSSVRE